MSGRFCRPSTRPRNSSTVSTCGTREMESTARSAERMKSLLASALLAAERASSFLNASCRPLTMPFRLPRMWRCHTGHWHSLPSSWWHSILTSSTSLRPLMRCVMNELAFTRSRAYSRMESMAENAALRKGRPSSILCLNGPRSTSRCSFSSMLEYRIGKTPTSAMLAPVYARPPSSMSTSAAPPFDSPSPSFVSSRRYGFTTATRWCTIALRDSNAARRTLRSASVRPLSSCAAASRRNGAVATLAAAYLSAVATVQRVLTSASPAISARRLTIFSGDTLASLPRHSAVMLRTPSSSWLQCAVSSGMTVPPYGVTSNARPCCESTSRSADSSR
mmetsp:Transcript_21734/g.76317  ORF Transcript_21734/g.76317 Transcript_21734/m.76317 type:complete len:334 (+) Transcript_21734:215-1216(+)